VLTTEVGVRASTPDGLPLVGWSATPGVMLAVGARRNGWLLAPLVADLVAAYLKGDNPGPDAAPSTRGASRGPERQQKQGRGECADLG
jgi:glycine oxidase